MASCNDVECVICKRDRASYVFDILDPKFSMRLKVSFLPTHAQLDQLEAAVRSFETIVRGSIDAQKEFDLACGCGTEAELYLERASRTRRCRKCGKRADE